MTFPEFASVLGILFYLTPLGYLNSDSGQHQTTSLQCADAVERLVRVMSVWQNLASQIFFRRLRKKFYIS